MKKSQEFISKLNPFISNDSDYIKEDLEKFFSKLFDDGFNESLWPYDYEKEGLRLEKLFIKQNNKKGLGKECAFKFAFDFKDKKNNDAIAFNVTWANGGIGSILVNLNSVKKTGNLSINNFSWNFVERHKKLLDNLGGKKENNRMLLNAYSGNCENGIGGYKGSLVWATRGFNFTQMGYYIDDMQKSFAKFLSKRKIHLTKKERSQFTKPYHFAVFRPDLKETIKVKNVNNGVEIKEVSLGKIFLIKELKAWNGVLYGGDRSKEEYEFAKNYHSSKEYRIIMANSVNRKFNTQNIAIGNKLELGLNNLQNRFNILNMNKKVRRV